MSGACTCAVTAKSQGSFARPWVLPSAVVALRPPRRALPPLSRSYEPMRQTKTLATAWIEPIPSRLCRLSPIPAGRWSFPTLLPVLCVKSSGPVPRCSLPVHTLISSQEASAFRKPRNAIGSQEYPHNATSMGVRFSRLQSFANVQTPSLARPTDCTYRRSCPLGSWAVYTTQDLAGYPTQVVASLRDRTE